MTHLRTILMLCLLALPVGAANIYVTQSGGGTNISLAVLNQWTNVSAGDTVDLIGTFTNQLTPTVDYPRSNPVRLDLSQALFSKAFWGPTRYDAAIATPNGVYLGGYIFDGGIIEATANGYNLQYQTNCFGVFIGAGGNGIEIKNMTIRNLYTNVPYGPCPSLGVDFSNVGIDCGGPSVTNILIHNNNLSGMLNGIQTSYGGPHSEVIDIYSNSVLHINQGILWSASTTSGTITGFKIHDNIIDHFDTFEPTNSCGLWWHSDAIFNNNALLTCVTNYGMRIYNNYMGSHVINSSGYINLTPSDLGSLPGLLVYNNIAVAGPGTVQLNTCFASATRGATFAFNTVVSQNGGGVAFGVNPNNATLIGNLIYGLPLLVNVQYDCYFFASNNLTILQPTNDSTTIVCGNTTLGATADTNGWVKVIDPDGDGVGNRFIWFKQPSSFGMVYNYNCYWSSNWDATVLFGWNVPNATTYRRPMSLWHANGNDLQSSTNQVILNPDYSLATNSPAGIGMVVSNLTSLGITTYYNGAARSYPSDAGALPSGVYTAPVTNAPGLTFSQPITIIIRQ